MMMMMMMMMIVIIIIIIVIIIIINCITFKQERMLSWFKDDFLFTYITQSMGIGFF